MMNPVFNFWGKTLAPAQYQEEMNRLIDQGMGLMASWQHALADCCKPDAFFKMSGQSVRLWESGMDEFRNFAFGRDKSGLEDLEKKLEVLNDNYAEALEEIKEQKKEIAALKRENTRQTKELDACRKLSTEQKKEIGAKDAQIKNLEKEVKPLPAKAAKEGAKK